MEKVIHYINQEPPLPDIGPLPTDKQAQAIERKRRTIENWRIICDNLNKNK